MLDVAMPTGDITEIRLPDRASVLYQVITIVKLGSYDWQLDAANSRLSLEVLRGIKVFVEKYESSGSIVGHLHGSYMKLARTFPFDVFIDSIAYSSLEEPKVWDGETWLYVAAKAISHFGCVTRTIGATIQF